MTDTLPKPPGHPEPHTYTWTKLELEAIERYGAECRRQALEEAARVCEEDAFVDQWRGLAEAAERIRTLKDKP